MIIIFCFVSFALLFTVFFSFVHFIISPSHRPNTETNGWLLEKDQNAIVLQSNSSFICKSVGLVYIGPGSRSAICFCIFFRRSYSYFLMPLMLSLNLLGT